MKSLAERLKEKEAREAKERLKRSGRVRTFPVRIPICGCPLYITEGDKIYMKKRAQIVMKSIRARSSWQFYQELKAVIEEMEKKRKEEEELRQAYYATVRVSDRGITVDPANPAAPPQSTPTTPTDPVPTPPTQPIESPGVSVREIDSSGVVTLNGQQGETFPSEEQRIENIERVLDEMDRIIEPIASTTP